MPDPALQTYFGVQGWAVLCALAILSFALFGWRIAFYVSVLRKGRQEIRWDHFLTRFKRFAVNVLGQKRLFGEPVIGAAHFLIFWSFVVYASSFFWNLIRGAVPALPIPYADEIGPVAFAVELFGLLGLAALAVAAARRYFFTPPQLERSRDATIVLLLITGVLATSLGAAGASAMIRPSAWRPIGGAIAGLYVALGVSQPEVVYTALWWAHMVIVLGFLAYLPYSKHMHLLASPFGVFLSDLGLAKAPASSEGANQLGEFTWREMFSGLACAECGRCDRACPAFASGAPLSPKALMHELKRLVRAGDPAGTLLNGTFKPEHVWCCSACASCMEHCPVFNEHLAVTIELRRKLMAGGEIDPRLQTALVNLTRYGNSFGQSPRNRAKWTQGLGFKVKDARKEAVEFLWLTGDYAAFDPRAQAVTAATAQVFQRAGLNFGILYEGEQNSGCDVRRAGEEGLFEALRDKNQAALGKARFERIVTGDPHTYHALKNDCGLNGRVVHSSELVDGLIDSRKLSIARRAETRVTYHDPCYLGRYNGVYEPPRRLLRALGVRLVEMPRNRAGAWCCGAGGGRIWMEDTPGVRERPAENRIREAAALDQVGTLVVACPKDLAMFEDALKTTGLESKLVVRDLIQLAEEGSRPNGGTNA